MVRRVLPEPHVPRALTPRETENEKLLDQIRTEVRTLRSVTGRIIQAEDRVRVKYILRRLENLVL